MSRGIPARNGKNGMQASAGPAPVRCAIYTRKSTSAGLEQEFNSLDAQREACEAYIRSQSANGWQTLDEHYDDGGFTGANLERPAFRKLLTDIDAGKLDVVVVYKVDRLSRSLLDFAQVMDRFNRARVAFVSVTQNFTTADSIGKLTLNLLMSFAEFEREMIAERTRDKMAAARRRGKWTGGSVPLGYEVVDHKLSVNPVEAVVVREAFDLYLEHKSALTVAQMLNARRRSTKRHKAENGNVRETRAWTKDAVLRLLRSPLYAGYMSTGEDLHEGEHEGIVDRELFHRVQALLEGRQVTSRDVQRNPAYVLRGVLRCAACGAAMTPASNRKNGRVYRYYRCTTRDKQGARACATMALPADAIERFVFEKIRDAVQSGKLKDEVVLEMEQRIDARRTELRKMRSGLPGDIQRIRLESSALAEKCVSSAGPVRDLLDQRLAEATEALARSEDLLRQVDQSLALLTQAEVDARWVARSLSDFESVWDVMTPENRGRLVRALVESVQVDGAAGSVTVTLAQLSLPPVPGRSHKTQGANHASSN